MVSESLGVCACLSVYVWGCMHLSSMNAFTAFFSMTASGRAPAVTMNGHRFKCRPTSFEISVNIVDVIVDVRLQSDLLHQVALQD